MDDILLHSKIYRKKHLLRTADAFKDLADFRIKKDKEYYRVQVMLKEKEFKDTISDEFCNYVISEIKSGTL